MTLRILHVDDDENIRALTALAFELGGSGAEVTSVPSGPEALARLEAGLTPDAILLDVMMPEMDGPAVLSRIRERPACARTPVIFMTAHTQDEETARLMALDAQGVIIKPFDPLSLSAQVESFLNSEP